MENNIPADNRLSGRTAPDSGVRRSSFPAWYDYAVLLVLFGIAQMIIALVASECGLTPEALAVVNAGTADPDTLLSAQQSVARATAAGYLAGMSAMVVMTLAYRHLRGGGRLAVRFSSAGGFNPSLLLGCFATAVAIQVVLEPLVALLPGMPDYNFLGRGGWALLCTVVFAPIIEEYLFRGVIMESVRAKRGVVAAWCLSSVCFGVAHGMPAQIVATMAVGFVLGYAYLRSGSLMAGILLHAMNNALAMFLLMLGPGSDAMLSEMLSPGVYRAVYAVSAVVVAVWLWRACRHVAGLRRAEKSAASGQ